MGTIHDIHNYEYGSWHWNLQPPAPKVETRLLVLLGRLGALCLKLAVSLSDMI